jgi:hypothetical protein
MTCPDLEREIVLTGRRGEMPLLLFAEEKVRAKEEEEAFP